MRRLIAMPSLLSSKVMREAGHFQVRRQCSIVATVLADVVVG